MLFQVLIDRQLVSDRHWSAAGHEHRLSLAVDLCQHVADEMLDHQGDFLIDRVLMLFNVGLQ